MLHIGILIFPEVEVLDFAGPFEVFSIAENNDQKKLCNVFLVSENLSPVNARNGLIVLPNFEYKNCPPMDILIVPGGYGAEEIEIKNQTTLSWIKTKYLEVKHLASICTGAFLLAELGLLKGLDVTTHWMDINTLKNNYPLLNVKEKLRYTDNGKILTSGGISSGIHLSFYLLQKLFGLEVATRTAKRMEYDWSSDQDRL
ncbi:DJ-1/PfpI family protein [Leptospira bandrabouensis]|uniref:DJ-1/PfpI family protein n=1 Tax=Leptospira bandrabouensis TaxID=2484903 RepID=UPI00223E1DE4|nr:DJ-1/PfpI family protein [Leptospira bandrabouensis]MCW7458769.1 DJ-1/PfpI family protein [Leptospira bandrabouensis]MCW7476670.1 DJ-1/PfpI family protein [Leptospira bandrabouensis]MCW7484352.1 DJ-1/PfpI family protein [Leptospira bandrabouensis]